MRKVLAIFGGFVFCMAMVGTAVAQYTIQTPGQPPTNVNPMPGGGYMI